MLNILDIFYQFSKFSQFHSLITQNKIGDQCMKTLDLESKRQAVYENEIEKKRLKGDWFDK